MPNNFKRVGSRRFCSVRAVSSTGGVWCLLPEEARVPLLRRLLRRLSTSMKLSPLRIMYEERSVDFSSPCLCLIKSAVLRVCMFWYSASCGAAAAGVVASWLVPLPSLFFREEWRPTRRQTFSICDWCHPIVIALFAASRILFCQRSLTRALTIVFS